MEFSYITNNGLCLLWKAYLPRLKINSIHLIPNKKGNTKSDTTYTRLDGGLVILSETNLISYAFLVSIPIISLTSITFWRKRNKKCNN